MTSSFHRITVSSEQLEQAAQRLAAKFDLDPTEIDVLAWLEIRVESMLEEADAYVERVSELRPFLRRRSRVA